MQSQNLNICQAVHRQPAKNRRIFRATIKPGQLRHEVEPSETGLPVPLVLERHQHGSCGTQFEVFRKGDRKGFVLVLPRQPYEAYLTVIHGIRPNTALICLSNLAHTPAELHDAFLQRENRQLQMAANEPLYGSGQYL
jgi:hypothetical protein